MQQGCSGSVAVNMLMMHVMEVMANFLGCSPASWCVTSVNFSGNLDHWSSQSIDAA
jgi:hypothetical protein